MCNPLKIKTIIIIIIILSMWIYSNSLDQVICLCWGFTAQSTQWGHVERGQFT